jgi:NADH:ubiquinone oxidoreductase subunit F (NADH-binding)
MLAEDARRSYVLIRKSYSEELLSRSLRKAISEARRYGYVPIELGPTSNLLF